MTKRSSYDDLPMNEAACRHAVFEYYVNGVHPGNGSFVEAVLCNDLRESFGFFGSGTGHSLVTRRADDRHLGDLFGITAWMWRHMPAHAWGSPVRVARHVARVRQHRAILELGLTPRTCDRCGWYTSVVEDSPPPLLRSFPMTCNPLSSDVPTTLKPDDETLGKGCSLCVLEQVHVDPERAGRELETVYYAHARGLRDLAVRGGNDRAEGVEDDSCKGRDRKEEA